MEGEQGHGAYGGIHDDFVDPRSAILNFIGFEKLFLYNGLICWWNLDDVLGIINVQTVVDKSALEVHDHGKGVDCRCKQWAGA